MTPNLSDARLELARSLSEVDFMLKRALDPAKYQLVSKALGRLMEASSTYTSTLVAARSEKSGLVAVPRFLDPKMHAAIADKTDPVEIWHAALHAAGVE